MSTPNITAGNQVQEPQLQTCLFGPLFAVGDGEAHAAQLLLERVLGTPLLGKGTREAVHKRLVILKLFEEHAEARLVCKRPGQES